MRTPISQTTLRPKGLCILSVLLLAWAGPIFPESGQTGGQTWAGASHWESPAVQKGLRSTSEPGTWELLLQVEGGDWSNQGLLVELERYDGLDYNEHIISQLPGLQIQSVHQSIVVAEILTTSHEHFFVAGVIASLGPAYVDSSGARLESFQSVLTSPRYEPVSEFASLLMMLYVGAPPSEINSQILADAADLEAKSAPNRWSCLADCGHALEDEVNLCNTMLMACTTGLPEALRSCLLGCSAQPPLLQPACTSGCFATYAVQGGSCLASHLTCVLVARTRYNNCVHDCTGVYPPS